MNYLILNVAGIGDFFELIRWIYLLKKQNPGVNIDLVVSDRVYNYAKRCPYIRNVFCLKTKKNYVSLLNLGLFKVLKEIRKNEYDLILNTYGAYSLWGNVKMMFFLKFLKCKKSVGIKTNFLNYYDETVEDDFKSSHYFYYSLVFKKIGVSDEEVDYNKVIWYDKYAESKVKDYFKNYQNKKIVLVNPFSNMLTNRLDNKKWKDLIDKLASKNFLFVIIGTLKFKKDINEIIGNKKHQNIMFFDNLSFDEWILCIKNSDIIISVDSSTWHLGALLCKKIILLSGPVLPDRVMSYENKNVNVIYKKVFCSPCEYYTCPNKGENYMLCMRTINVDEIVDVFNRIEYENNLYNNQT